MSLDHYKIRSLEMHYVLTCKQSDHKYLYEWLNAFTSWPWHQHRDQKGRIHRYRWRNGVPLSAQEEAPDVNYFEYQLDNEKGKITYEHGWVTDITVDERNIWHMIQSGRCRWKIENECFNTLKNQGYHMTHNFGHGEKHLSHNMYLSTLLAFLLHQILELCDEAYQQCRQRHSKTALWTRIRERLLMVIIEDWYWLMMWILDPKQEQVTLVATETEQ